MKSRFWFVVLPVLLVSHGCEDSTTCPCGANRVDPPMSDLSVAWKDGSIWGNLMPVVPPDPIICNVSLVLENKNRAKSFSRLEIPRATVSLSDRDSTLGAIPLETNWAGYLAPATKDTIQLYKNASDRRIFDPPCGERVVMEFFIRNADGDTTVFESDTLDFDCTF